MLPQEEDAMYREFIDDLVHCCLRGPGQFSGERVIEGIWHRQVDSIRGDEELTTKLRTINEVLAGLDERERQTVAWLLEDQYAGAMHDVLVRLHQADIRPFDKGYWDPHHDFYMRLDGDDWPVDQERG